MKLLLTSNGLCNRSITNALFDLVGKDPKDTTISFIPTAMNVTKGSKDWFARDVMNISKLNLGRFDIVDISALPRSIWEPRLESVDVLFFSGGDANHLMRWIKESGLIEFLPKWLESKVWVGISAGSIVTNPSLAVSSTDKKIYYEEQFGYRDEKALHLVDFYTRPHFNSGNFPHASEEYLRKIAVDFDYPIYAIDDETAIKVNKGNVEVVTEGGYLVL